MSSVLDGLAVDPGSDRAVFRQIADQLRAAIQNGRLSEGDRLPSEAQLIDHYGVARMTIRNALQLLEGEGLTRAEHGRGVYVRRKPPVRRIASDRFARRHRKEGKAAFLAESEQAGAIPDVDLIKVNEMTASPEMSERLNHVGPVIVRSRRYSLDGIPVETATSYIPADIGRGTPIQTPGLGESTLASKNSATPWSGLPRKSPQGCLPRLKRGYWRWRRGCLCSAWSVPRSTWRGGQSKSATPSCPPTRTSLTTSCPLTEHSSF